MNSTDFVRKNHTYWVAKNMTTDVAQNASTVSYGLSGIHSEMSINYPDTVNMTKYINVDIALESKKKFYREVNSAIGGK